MTERTPILTVRGLSVRFLMPGGRRIAAVTDAHFDGAAGECLALVGESGCGKSVLASALLGLLPANAQAAGEARIGDLDLLAADERTLARAVRGRLIGLIPQSPAAHQSGVPRPGASLLPPPVCGAPLPVPLPPARPGFRFPA